MRIFILGNGSEHANRSAPSRYDDKLLFTLTYRIFEEKSVQDGSEVVTRDRTRQVPARPEHMTRHLANTWCPSIIIHTTLPFSTSLRSLRTLAPISRYGPRVFPCQNAPAPNMSAPFAARTIAPATQIDTSSINLSHNPSLVKLKKFSSNNKTEK